MDTFDKNLVKRNCFLLWCVLVVFARGNIYVLSTEYIGVPPGVLPEIHYVGMCRWMGPIFDLPGV